MVHFLMAYSLYGKSWREAKSNTGYLDISILICDFIIFIMEMIN